MNDLPTPADFGIATGGEYREKVHKDLDSKQHLIPGYHSKIRSGRQKAAMQIRKLAGEWGPQAIQKCAELAGLVVDEKGIVKGAAISEAVQLGAINILLDRAYGKPIQQIAGDEENPLVILHQMMATIDGRSRGIPATIDGSVAEEVRPDDREPAVAAE